MTQELKTTADPDIFTCSPTPNPLIGENLRAISCRTLSQWKAHLKNDATIDFGPNPATQGLELDPADDLYIDAQNVIFFLDRL